MSASFALHRSEMSPIPAEKVPIAVACTGVKSQVAAANVATASAARERPPGAALASFAHTLRTVCCTSRRPTLSAVLTMAGHPVWIVSRFQIKQNSGRVLLQ